MMREDDEEKAAQELMADLDKMTAGYEWIAASMEKMDQCQQIFRKIIALLPTDQSVFSPSFNVAPDLEFLRLASPSIRDACKLLAKPAEAGYGYKIELRGKFIYEMINCHGKLLSETHEGLFLTLVSPESKVAGILGVHVGLPFEIWAVQGDNLGECQNFFKASNGKTFDIALVSHFISCVGNTIYYPRGHPLRKVPKAKFSLLEGDMMHPKLMKRLSQYVPEKERETFIKGHLELGTCLNLKGIAPIKDNLFCHARAVGARQARQQVLAR